MNHRDMSLFLAHQRSNSDPAETLETRIEQRIVGLFSATKRLLEFNLTKDGQEIISRPRCREDLELARDYLSLILDRGKK
jgi:hypothetical protein